jgi:hypothetical protein
MIDRDRPGGHRSDEATHGTRILPMPQLIWFNQPTNHSGAVNFLFLDPDGQIGHFTLDAPDGGGPYILGGPALRDDGGFFTEAAQTLISLLPAGIHIFPPTSKSRFLQAITKHRAKISDKSFQIHESEWFLQVCSQDYTTTECCDMLLQNAQPASAIAFVDEEQDGVMQLAVELALIYYRLPKEQRKKLKLGPDWRHSWDG